MVLFSLLMLSVKLSKAIERAGAVVFDLLSSDCRFANTQIKDAPGCKRNFQTLIFHTMGFAVNGVVVQAPNGWPTR
jgi:hypothetical protein